MLRVDDFIVHHLPVIQQNKKRTSNVELPEPCVVRKTLLHVVHAMSQQGEPWCHMDTVASSDLVCSYWKNMLQGYKEKKKRDHASFSFLHTDHQTVMIDNNPPPLCVPGQVHAKPVSQMRTSCITFNWQCLQVREQQQLCWWERRRLCHIYSSGFYATY